MSVTATRACAICGVDLPDNLGPGRPPRYCGPLCRDAGTAQWRTAENERRRQAYELTPPRTISCAHCGDTIHIGEGRRDRTYCSRRCKENARKKRIGAAMVEATCCNCGATFRQTRRHLAHRRRLGKPIYCSRACWNEIARPPTSRGPRRRLDANTGYVFIAGFGAEHRHVMEQHLGRALRIGEFVHHRNGDRADNRIANLELWVRPHPSGQRREDLIDAGRDIERDAIIDALAGIGVCLTVTDDGVYAASYTGG